MGMYDTLHLTCPKCKKDTEYQSKWGPQGLADFGLSNAPITIIADAWDEGSKGRLFCEHCDAEFKIKIGFNVEVALVEGDDEDTYTREV